MDAREALARGLAAKRHDTPWEELRPWTRACFRTLALTVERILHAAGFTILHDSQNHGPTRDRAAGVADSMGKGSWTLAPGFDRFRTREGWAERIASNIRAMEVKP